MKRSKLERSRRGRVLWMALAAAMALATPALGQTAAGSTTRVSVATGGGQATGVTAAVPPALSSDGRYVAFHSRSTNLVPSDTNGTDDVLVRDLQDGITTRMSVSSAGAQAAFQDTPPRNNSSLPDISANGRFVAFLSGAFNLVTNDTNGVPAAAASADLTGRDVFVRDRQAGTTTRVSVATGGAQGDCGVSAGPQPPAGQLLSCGGGVASADAPSISGDGTFVAFAATATNLVTGCTPAPTPPARCDTNNQTDVFVHDRTGAGTTTRVSVATGGAQATGGASVEPSISADGNVIAFRSLATNLVANDTNSSSDIFVHDRRTGATTRVSLSTTGEQATGAPGPTLGSFNPKISEDGCFVAFHSTATNLLGAGLDANGVADVFVRGPICPGATGPVTTTRVSAAAATGTGTPIGEANGNSLFPDISATGRYVGFESDASNLLPPGTDTNNQTDVFVHDRTTLTTARVSLPNGGGQASGFSFFPALSGDGRLVAFSSEAANLFPGDTNAQPDVFVNDRAAAAAPQPAVANPSSGGADGTGAPAARAAAGASAAAAPAPAAPATARQGAPARSRVGARRSAGRNRFASTGASVIGASLVAVTLIAVGWLLVRRSRSRGRQPALR